MTGTGPLLVADIGGTNARFALVRTPGLPEQVRSLPLADYSSFDNAIDAYMVALAISPRSLAGMAIAVAGPVQAGSVKMTNASWHLNEAALSAHFGGIPVQIINDLAAVALALPFLEPGHVRLVQEGELKGRSLPLIAINAGTGLGAAVAVPSGERWIPLATEAGHMRLAALDEKELVLFRGLQTVEDLIAGPGWQRFQSGQRSGAGGQGELLDSRGLYSHILGRFAGDLVLATGAWGGVYFCGGVMNNWDTLIDKDVLLNSFTNHGPMCDLLRTVPLYRVTLEDPALKGLALAGAT